MEIERPTDVPVDGLLCDILWSDPCTVSYTYLLVNKYNLFIFASRKAFSLRCKYLISRALMGGGQVIEE